MRKERICLAPECDVIITGTVAQKRYCDKCRKLRGKALYFTRQLRQEVKKLSEDVYDYIIEVKVSDTALQLSAQHKDKPYHDISLVIREGNDVDVAVLLKFIYRGLRYVGTSSKKYKEIL